MSSTIKVMEVKKALRLKKSEEHTLSTFNHYASMRYVWELAERPKHGPTWDALMSSLASIEGTQLNQERRMELLSRVVKYVDKKVTEGDRATCVG